MRPKATHHDEEHSYWNRRSFIQALGLAGGGCMLLGGHALSANKATPLSVALSESECDRILVIIRLEGGNDGLNTIIPLYDYDNYANLRPTLRHEERDIIRLDDDFGIPDFMHSLEGVWHDGKMKVIHGVGYDNQNLSHFTSSNIWASSIDDYKEPTGWWGRYFEERYPNYVLNPPERPLAVQIGKVGNLIFDGQNANYALSVANIEQLQNIAQSGLIHSVTDLPDCVYGDRLLFMRSTANTTSLYSGFIHEAYTSAQNSSEYSDGDLARQLASVARLIKGNLGSRVYMVSLGTFDTHANQKIKHQKLLQDFSSSISSFYEDLRASGMDDKVLSMTISEFGRRPFENGSLGTDHGTASPVMLFGPGLEGNGFMGEHPDLLNWDDSNNLIPSTDFRDVYSMILTDWFCLAPDTVNALLMRQSDEEMQLDVTNQNPLRPNYLTNFKHQIIRNNNRVHLEINMNASAYVFTELFDLMGRKIGTLSDKTLPSGNHSIDIQNTLGYSLTRGQYIYRISIAGKTYSKSFIF